MKDDIVFFFCKKLCNFGVSVVKEYRDDIVVFCWVVVIRRFYCVVFIVSVFLDVIIRMGIVSDKEYYIV